MHNYVYLQIVKGLIGFERVSTGSQVSLCPVSILL